MKHEFSNEMTEECVKEFFPNLLLEEAFIFEEDIKEFFEDVEDIRDKRILKALVENVADKIYEVLYDSIAFDCNYKTSSLCFEWAKKAIDEIKCEEIAKAMLVDYLE